MDIPLVDLKAQYTLIRDEVRDSIERVLNECNFILGDEVRSFEREFAKFCGTEFGIGVGSGTDAIHLAIRAIGLGPGDEALIPANTFIATALGVTYSGATPVPVDVDPATFLMDVPKIESAITPRTRAIVPVHLYGRMMELDPVIEIARRYNLLLVEDAAQAHGAEIKGRKAGSVGVAGCFSFYPGKNLGAYGDAGMVVTNDEDLKTRLEALRNYGSTQKYYHPMLGYNSRLDTIQAAILRTKLRRLDSFNAARFEVAQKYNSALQGIGDLVLPQIPSGKSHVFHLYVARTGRRDALLQYLQSRGIGVVIHYPKPIHLHGAYKHLGYEAGSFPVAEQLSNQVISFPIFPEITDEQIAFVAEAVKDFFESP